MPQYGNFVVFNMEAQLIAQALPAGVLEAVCSDARALAECKNYWVPKGRIQEGCGACATPAELAVCLLYRHVAHLLPDTWQGAEYWVQVYKPGVGLGFHFDKDEHLLKATGQMVHPIWSSILYLTGTAGPAGSNATSQCSSDRPGENSSGNAAALHHQQHKQEQEQPQQQGQESQQEQLLRGPAFPDDWDGVRQAPTVILQQLFDQELSCPVPSAPSRSLLVWPVKGTYCLFDGRLGHGVLDSSSSNIRATLLVNWWTACPREVEPLQDSTTEQHQLTRLSSSQVQQLLATACAGGNCSRVASACSNHLAARLGDATLADCSSDGTADKSHSCSEGGAGSEAAFLSNCRTDIIVHQSQHEGQWQQQQQQQALPEHSRLEEQPPWPVLSVGSSYLAGSHGAEDSGMQLVDDVLASNDLSLIGSAAVNAVEFDHPGFVLCPIEDPYADQSADCAEQQGADGAAGRLQTLGAFVSSDCLGADSDSSCSSGEDCGVEYEEGKA